MENYRNQIVRRIAVFVALFVCAPGIAAAVEPEVPLPEGYHSWQQVKSEVTAGKTFQFYANPQAAEGYRAGKFPNGSVLVRETLHDGARSALDVMRKDDQLYKETGGWGFETFDSKYARLAEKDRAQCYTCHLKQKDHDLVFTTLSGAAAGAGTPYPEGYRHWTFLHSSMVPANFDAFGKKPCEKPCTAGVFHFYANDKAMDGLRTGSYPDGAILAEEMLEWISSSNGGGKEGPRRIIGVMVKDSQRYSSTGGWGYGNFDDGSRTDTLDTGKRETCHQCHVARQDKGYVFTEYRER
jgi:hypothetical protein